MKIILTEMQLSQLIDHNKNYKSSYEFDKRYGTKLSHRYDLRPYNEGDIWNRWLECRSGQNCHKFIETFKILSKSFPYIDISKLDNKQKSKIIQGIVAEYNPFDIVYFVMGEMDYSMNKKMLEHELPYDIYKDINWVISPESIQKIKNKLGII